MKLLKLFLFFQNLCWVMGKGYHLVLKLFLVLLYLCVVMGKEFHLVLKLYHLLDWLLSPGSCSSRGGR